MNVNNDQADSILKRYQRARDIEQSASVEGMVKNASIYPNWIDGCDQFWYLRRGTEGHQFRIVDAAEGTNTLAFDHAILAGALSEASGQTVDPKRLPINELIIKYEERGDKGTSKELEFVAFNEKWRVDKYHQCKQIFQAPAHWTVSPDGKKAIFLRDNNLWLHDISSGDEREITSDGAPSYAYGKLPERVNLVGSFANTFQQPEGLWSLDSNKFFSMQTDERLVESLTVTSYAPRGGDIRPKSIQTKYALPGDQNIASYRLVIIDVNAEKIQDVSHPPIMDAVLWAGPFSGNRAWWSQDGERTYFLDMSRGQQQIRAMVFNLQTDETNILFEEYSETYIDLSLSFESPAAMMPLPETDELLWFSERSGWGHLYLYDLKKGVLKSKVTQGEWLVREILSFDKERRQVYIQAGGRVADRDPYYCEVCRVDIDTGELTVLASDDCHFEAYRAGRPHGNVLTYREGATHYSQAVSPSCNYVVVTRARVDQAPVTELINRDGHRQLEVEVADISGLPDSWQWPEPVKLKSAVGDIDLYGLVFRPNDFDPNQSYPILDLAHTNPFYSVVPKGGLVGFARHAFYLASAFAELGFIVVIIDGRGTCNRSKAFHDHAYGRVHKGSDLEDHIAGIRQLAARYSYMDLDRVGITDSDGSNSPAYGLLAYPDFYKVGASSSIWDVRLLTQSETYQGFPNDSNYADSVLGELSGNLKGKLLMIQGIMDPYFPLCGVLQLTDALVRENKDFDLVILPNGGHGRFSDHYGLRRMWDYLVRHLLEIEPPKDFILKNGLEYALDNGS